MKSDRPSLTHFMIFHFPLKFMIFSKFDKNELTFIDYYNLLSITDYIYKNSCIFWKKLNLKSDWPLLTRFTNHHFLDKNPEFMVDELVYFFKKINFEKWLTLVNSFSSLIILWVFAKIDDRWYTLNTHKIINIFIIYPLFFLLNK